MWRARVGLCAVGDSGWISVGWRDQISEVIGVTSGIEDAEEERTVTAS